MSNLERDPLVDAVSELTEETTELLKTYREAKTTIDGKVNAAASSAAQAQATVTEVRRYADDAKNEKELAMAASLASSGFADDAKAHADRASQIAGLEIVEEAVALATKMPLVHALLDNKLALLAGRGVPSQVTVPAQTLTVGAEEVTIAAQTLDVPETHNMKFSRASKAWLDGKTYEVDEPRYTQDGELLVEGQATNYGVGGSFYQQSDFGHDFVNEDGFQVFMRGNGASAGILANTVSPIVSQKVTISFDAYASKPIKINNISLDNGESGFVEIGTVVTRLHVTVMSGDTETTLIRLYGVIANTGDWIALKNLQVEVGDTPTSFIPTTTAAVTRAADIALISSENKVTKWAQESGDIPTEAPYYLPVGEHDAAPLTLLKFQRSTSAWLEGVEYAAGEARYKNGKLLIEAQTTNLIPYSSALVNSNYGNSPASVEAVADPFGGMTGANVNPDDHADRFQFRIPVGFGVATYSWYEKQIVPQSEGNSYCNTGSLINCVAESPIPILVEALSDGWKRYRVTFTESLTTPDDPDAYFRLYFGNNVGVGNANYVHFAGLQCEYGAATSFIPTEGAAITRTADHAHVISRHAINTGGQLPKGEHSVSPHALTSFKRATPAWLDGVEYPADAPRYTKEGKLLIEPQATNMATLTAWSDSNNTMTFTLDADGVTHHMMETGVDSASSGFLIRIYSVMKSMPQEWMEKTPIVTYSAEIKGVGRNFVSICTSGVISGVPIFDLVNNAIAKEASNASIYSAHISPAAEGFSRVSITMKNISSVLWLRGVANDMSQTYQGEAGKGYLVRNLQVEATEFPTSYIPTTTETVTRAADIAVVDYQLPPNKYRNLKGYK